MFVKFHFSNIFALKKYQLVYSCGWFSTRRSSIAVRAGYPIPCETLSTVPRRSRRGC